MEPFVSQRQRRRRRLAARLKIYGVFILLLLLTSGVVWGMNRLPLIKLTSVNFVGGRRPPHANLTSKVIASVTGSFLGRLWGSDNMLSWPEGPLAVADVLMASVNIDRHWRTRTVTVTIIERLPYALWCSAPAETTEEKAELHCAVFDRDGVVLRTENKPDPEKPLPIVYDRDPSVGRHSDILGNLGMSTEPGDRVLPPDFFTRLVRVIEEFKNEPSLRAIEWVSQGLDVRIVFDSGPLLLFSLRFNPDISLRALKQLKESLGQAFSSLTEVDFRSENRVFYH